MAKNENKIIVADSMVKFFDLNIIMMIGLFGWVPSRRSFKTKEKSVICWGAYKSLFSNFLWVKTESFVKATVSRTVSCFLSKRSTISNTPDL